MIKWKKLESSVLIRFVALLLGPEKLQILLNGKFQMNLQRMHAVTEDDLSFQVGLTSSNSDTAEDDRESPEFHHVSTGR